jgi:Fic family protein
VKTHWREVEPLPALNGSVEPVLATVDSLRTAWEGAVSRMSPEEFNEARQRNLRSHAIETGIIERLYDLDWGITEALVAEGITIEVAEREGGVSEDALQLIRDQLDALGYLVQSVREGRDLSLFFIRELHQLITRHQPTYEARDALGNVVQVPLAHGDWKKQPNHVRRTDGSLLEYTPPEQVQPQLERLVELYAESAGAHPVARAAWLHHRFICIHPFADGNGRVARALTLLVLLQARMAPLVVDRRNREDYIRSLDAANDGDLRPLIRLFAQLEIVALRNELERPAVIKPASGSAIDIARAHADRIRAQRDPTHTPAARQAKDLAKAINRRVTRHLSAVGDELATTFHALDEKTSVDVARLLPPRSRRDKLAENTSLRLRTLDQVFAYIVVADQIGATAVKVVVVANAQFRREGALERKTVALLDTAPTDTVTLVATDTMEARWPEIEELIDRTLAAAIDAFGRLLS